MNKPVQYLTFRDRAAWRAWLAAHHATESEAWLIHYKKGASETGLPYPEAIEEALCFGWIDGPMHPVDAECFALRYSPRRRGSVWSASNVERVERLIRAGQMTPAGLARVAEAKANGEGAAALQRENVDVLPPDLERALRRRKGALAAFRALTLSQKKQAIWWITSAKREATRKRRIEATIARLL